MLLNVAAGHLPVASVVAAEGLLTEQSALLGVLLLGSFGGPDPPSHEKLTDFHYLGMLDHQQFPCAHHHIPSLRQAGC